MTTFPLALAGQPPAEVTYKGQTYRYLGQEGRYRVDGAQNLYHAFISACCVCGQPFVCRVPANPNPSVPFTQYPLRRCKPCRKAAGPEPRAKPKPRHIPFSDPTPAKIAQALDVIRAGAGAERYSSRPQDITRYAGDAFARHLKCSAAEAEHVLRHLLERGFAEVRSYYSKAQRKQKQGLFVVENRDENVFD